MRPQSRHRLQKKKVTHVHLPRHLALRTVVVMIGSAIASSLLFNFTTNGNAQLLAERLDGLVHEPAMLGLLLAVVYAVASFAQVVVGRLLDRVPIKPLLFGILLGQATILPWQPRPQAGFGMRQRCST